MRFKPKIALSMSEEEIRIQNEKIELMRYLANKFDIMEKRLDDIVLELQELRRCICENNKYI